MLSALIPSEHSYPALLLVKQLVHQRFVHFGPLVLEVTLLKFLTSTADRDRTVSRRSEPSSRAALIGEQPNPWGLLQFLFVELRRTHVQPSDHYILLSYLLGVYASQSSSHILLRYHTGFHSVLGNLWTPPLLFRRQPPQLNYPPNTVPIPDNGTG